MLFTPKKFKFKKQQKKFKINNINSSTKTFKIFGSVGLKTQSFGKLTSKQLVALKHSINKVIKKIGSLKINIFPQTPVTKKPKEVRMGKGKGEVSHWIFKIRPGTVLCEIATDSVPLAIKAFRLAQIRLPIKTRIILY